MSSEFIIKTYARTDLSKSVADSIIATVQAHGWTYNGIYPGGYTVDEEMDWVHEDRDDAAGGLSTAVESVVDLGIGAISLAREVRGEIRTLRVYFDARSTSAEGISQNSHPNCAIRISTSGRYVTADESVGLEFVDLLSDLAATLSPLVAFAGMSHRVPYLNLDSLSSSTESIAPVTYFGPEVASRLGRERIESAPAERVDHVGDGLLLVSCREFAAGCEPEVYDQISTHLGVNFYDEFEA